MNNTPNSAINKLIIQNHSLGQIDIASQLLAELQSIIKIGEKAIAQSGLTVVSTRYTGTVHNLADCYVSITSDTRDFYTYSARCMVTSYRYLHDAWEKANPLEPELATLISRVDTNESFVTFVRNRNSNLADELYRNFGRSLNDLHFSIYMKRNKAVEHKSNSNMKDRGILADTKYIHGCIDEDRVAQDTIQYQVSIDGLYSRIRGTRGDSLAYNLANKFYFIDYNYFNFSNADRNEINRIREVCNRSLVPLPVTQPLLNEIFVYINAVIDFIESKKHASIKE